MNRLEDALKRASTEPEFRAEFYRVFLESQIFMPTGNTADELKTGGGRLLEGVELEVPLMSFDGQDCVPVFTSLEKLTKAIAEGIRYVQMRARDFLELARGSFVVLNPGADCTKQFLPGEIDAMISGEILSPEYGRKVRRLVTEKPEQILLGQPAQYPTRLVDALKEAFSKNPQVKAAYLAHCRIPSEGSFPHTAIGIDTDDYDSVVAGIGDVVASVLGKEELVDFVSIRDGGVIAEYMLKQTKPFYGGGSAPARRRR